MTDKFEEIRKVRGSDVDFKNRLKLNALFNYMSDAAWVHAEKLHLGYFDLLKAAISGCWPGRAWSWMFILSLVSLFT